MKVLGANFSKDPDVKSSKQEITISYSAGWFKKTEIHVTTDLIEWEQITEQNKQKFGASMGWGALGAVLVGPLGAVAAAYLGGRKKKVVVACKFTENRRCALELSPDEFMIFQNTAPEGTSVAEISAADAARAGIAESLLKMKQLVDEGIMTQEEFDMKKESLLAKL